MLMRVYRVHTRLFYPIYSVSASQPARKYQSQTPVHACIALVEFILALSTRAEEALWGNNAKSSLLSVSDSAVLRSQRQNIPECHLASF